jgi:uncharacterized RDD family membrane protein YckC
MRCPKCHYLSFDPEPRCRNCGYGFSLEESDLPMREAEQEDAPLADLRLHDASVEPAREDWRGQPARQKSVAVSSVAVEPQPQPELVAASVPQEGFQARTAPAPRPSSTATTELPLFVKGLAAAEMQEGRTSDEPLVKVPAAPRAPLSVRRRTAEPGAARPRHTASSTAKLGPLDRDLLEDLQRIEKIERSEAVPETRAATSQGAPASDYVPGAGKRLAAAGVDAVLMAALSAGVVWITMRWSDLSVDRIMIASVLLPTLGFVLLMVLGYLLMFTAAGGQTIGKMVLGLRVVGEDADTGAGQALTTSQAVYRSVLMIPSVLMLGAGFVPALFGDERAVHDRLAHTRVVRA